MKIIWQYLKKYKKTLLLALGLATINRIFSLLDPQIFRLIIDNYATKFTELNASEFLRGVLLLSGAAVGVAFVSRVAKSFQDYYVNVVTQRLGTQLYADSVAHSFSLPYSSFEDQRSGELLQKLEKARDDTEKLVASMIDILFFSLIGILFVLIYSFTVHWSLGVTFFLIIPILSITTWLISRRIKEIQTTIVAEKADLSGSTTETLRNVELVKSLGLENQEVDRLNEANEKILALELKKVKLVRSLSFIQGTMINVLRSSLILLMLWLIFKQLMSLGEFFSMLFYSFLIFFPLTELGPMIAQYRETQASVAQLKKILEIKPEKKPTNPQTVSDIKQIKFKNVSFNYQSADQPSVIDINFSIKAGETVAFVGPSGSGKTTLVKLLVGLYKPNNGAIYFNEINSIDIDFGSLRRQIGLVSQDTQLFSGSIRDNLLFVNPKATDKDCLAALKAAALADIFTQSGQNLDTKIGEGGLKLSGGEKQRLAIARAILRKPELIIFDEATSSLDSITEQAITKTIKNIEKSKPELMRILVAHRLSTIMHADKIYVLAKGKIVETGNHSELLKDGGLYAALWREQSSI